jgi:hypothetical protein
MQTVQQPVMPDLFMKSGGGSREKRAAQERDQSKLSQLAL